MIRDLHQYKGKTFEKSLIVLASPVMGLTSPLAWRRDQDKTYLYKACSATDSRKQTVDNGPERLEAPLPYRTGRSSTMEHPAPPTAHTRWNNEGSISINKIVRAMQKLETLETPKPEKTAM
jgi:hypothetical protein